MVFGKDVEANGYVIPGSNHHLRMSAVQRLKMVFDNGTWLDVPLPEVPADPSNSGTRSATPTASRTPAPRRACRTRSRSASAGSTAFP
jgi:acetyl-CoA carboxylase beta subunit